MSTRVATDTSLHPLVALGAMKRLIGSPDDTRQVFVILRALRGRSGVRMFRRFERTETGARILREGRNLLEVLDNHDALARLTPASLGRAYLDFMMAENLSAAGLLETARSVDPDIMSDDERFYVERMRVLHDVGHVVTGYGREPLGELCLLAFSFGQSGHLGMGLIVLMAMTKFGRGPAARAARAAVIEGWRRGRRALWLGVQDWEGLLAEPLAAVREQLRIAAPVRYVGAV